MRLFVQSDGFVSQVYWLIMAATRPAKTTKSESRVCTAPEAGGGRARDLRGRGASAKSAAHLSAAAAAALRARVGSPRPTLRVSGGARVRVGAASVRARNVCERAARVAQSAAVDGL